MKKHIIVITLAIIALQACSLEEDMVSSGSRELVFRSASGLEAYSLSFYNQLPSLSDLSSAEGTCADYIAAKSINSVKVDKSGSDKTYSTDYTAGVVSWICVGVGVVVILVMIISTKISGSRASRRNL